MTYNENYNMDFSMNFNEPNETEENKTEELDRGGFKRQLKKLIYTAAEISPVSQAQWEKLLEIYNFASLSIEVIIQTISRNNAFYSQERLSLNFPSISPRIPLSANQQIALEMALSNSPITVISGTGATGKTSIAKNLAQVAIDSSHKVLILAHNLASLSPYYNLTNYPLVLSQQGDYYQKVINRLRYDNLAQAKMDYLPLHLLPDVELSKLRTPAKLERWLPIIENNSYQQLADILKLESEFQNLTQARLNLLAYRLKQLLPFLQEQLRLNQIYNHLSQAGIEEIARQLLANPQITITGTVAEFMQVENRLLWETSFDIIIVEEANRLHWIQLLFLAGLCKKLVLFGEDIPPRYGQPKKSIPYPYNCLQFNCFQWLQSHLSPAYVYTLKEQFRLHSAMAKIVYPSICNHWVYSQSHYIDNSLSGVNLSQINRRVVWQDVSDTMVGDKPVAENMIRFLEKLIRNHDGQVMSEIGMITFSPTQTDAIKEILPTISSIYQNQLFVGTAGEWSGKERKMIMVNCSGNPKDIPVEDINIALTRAKDYLFLFGDCDVWLRYNSPLRALLYHPAVSQERQVVI